MFSAFPTGTFKTILADPPWNFVTRSAKGKGRSADRYYLCMSIDAIKALPVAGLAADDCTLFLWATFPHLVQALTVIEAWGFTYKSGAVWAKPTRNGQGWAMGCGYWWRGNPELLLPATRGRPKRVDRGQLALIVAPRREHSRKPDEAYERIERLVAGPYLELFARHTRPGWATWGLEKEKFRATRVEELPPVCTPAHR
jgi:N6-adenosine-specific RNA methylase IME4